MKKSLVIISFAFIFLLSVSVVSAGFFDWITGDDVKTGTAEILPTSISTTETFKVGKIATLSPDANLQITEVNEELGTVGATVTFADGKTQNVQLEQGTNTLTDGTKLTVEDVKESWLFGDKAKISFQSPTDSGFPDAGVDAGTEGTTGEFADWGLAGGSFLAKVGDSYYIDDVLVKVISVEETSGPTIYEIETDGKFRASLIEGQPYNIPRSACGFWEVTIIGGEATFVPGVAAA